VKLARITLREIRLPLVEPFRTASGTVRDRRVLLMHLADTDGTETWSECVAESVASYSPETVDSCWLAVTELLGPAILDEDSLSSLKVSSILDRVVRDNRMAKAAIEMGIWALESKRRGISLASFLAHGSEVARDKVSPRAYVETGIALGMQGGPEALAKRAEDAFAEGYPRIKMKIEPGRDLDYVRAVREVLGEEVQLTADANCSYTLSDDHVQALKSLDEFRLTMIEQPLGRDDLTQHAELGRKISTPICLDESITSLARTNEMIALNAASIVNLKPGRVGGFSESIAIHDTCALASIPVWCGGMLETGIGRAYNVALASLPNFTMPGDLSPSSRYWERDIVTPEWTMDSAGRVSVPLDEPGLGVDVNVGLIDDLTVKTAEIVQP
jgi:O-succinylbenzoate synthase